MITFLAWMAVFAVLYVVPTVLSYFTMLLNRYLMPQEHLGSISDHKSTVKMCFMPFFNVLLVFIGSILNIGAVLLIFRNHLMGYNLCRRLDSFRDRILTILATPFLR